MRALAAVERRIAPGANGAPSRVPPREARSIVEAFPDMTLAELMADTTPVSINDTSLAWLGLPSAEFMDWVMGREPEAFDAVTPTADITGAPTFPQLQAHRLSLTIGQVREWMPGASGLVVDVGSYPFSAPVAMRQFLGYRGRILATVNKGYAEDVTVPLARLGIDHAAVNLDPLVAASTHVVGMTDAIPLADSSADLVLLGHVIEHLYHPMLVLREIARVLKPGGALVATTDNALMLHGLVNQLQTAPYLHEPVDQTAAMLFDDWRRHVRFFTADDLAVMANAVGLDTVETRHNEVLYGSVPESVFSNPIVTIPAWQARILSAVPALRNDVAITAVKR
jgi:SAM-dependent methyltransferase